MTENEDKYWAFLSYSPQDNCEKRPDTQDVSRLCWGDWLHDALQTFSIPAEFIGQINGRGEIIPERIHPIFRDEQELPGDAGLSADVREALEQSRCLVVICSPRSAQSRHVNEVVRYFKQLGRGRQVLPIVIAGEPHASEGSKPGISDEDECFVPALRHPVHPEGTLDTARRAGRNIFVDARHGVEKREILAKDHRSAEADLEMAKIQLIALLVGVGFNGLWWREQKRHFFDFTEARHQAREALHQVEDVRRQLQEAQRQAHEAQNRALEMQNLPRDVHGQIQEAQNQAKDAQDQTREAKKQLQEFQYKVRDTQTQLEEARQRAIAAESKVMEGQQQARELQNQLEATRNLARTEHTTQSQLEEIRHHAQDAQGKFMEAQSQLQESQNQARSAQSELEKARIQVREAQGKVQEAQQQARDAQDKLQEIQGQSRDAQSRIQDAWNQAQAAQNQVQEIQNKSRTARRLAKIFALLAVLALLAAGMAANIALQQRKAASQSLARAASEALGRFDPASDAVDKDQIRQVLRKIGGAEQQANRWLSLDKLAAWIPVEEIPEALQASSVIADDQQRSLFQKRLLIRLGWASPVAAMTCAGTIEGNIVNDEGQGDRCSYFQLAVLDNWIQTDLPGAFGWACQLPDGDSRQRALEKIIPVLTAENPQTTMAWLSDLNPEPDEAIYRELFLRWAAIDPFQTIQLRQQLPDQDQGDLVLCAIMRAWMEREPDAALDWVKSQPDSESRNKALETCIGELAKTDVPGALALAEFLPEGDRRSTVMAGLITTMPQTVMQPKEALWPWTKFLLNSDLGSLKIFSVDAEILPVSTNDPVQIGPKE